MKIKKLLFTVAFTLSVALAAAQNFADSVRTEGYLPIRRTDATKWMLRYNGDILRYQAENNKPDADLNCDVLFLGSSSINLWKDIYTDMAPMKIIRRSYGGATIRDMIYNYNTIARGYNPRKIAIYVENDLGFSKESMTAGDTYDMFRLFIQMVQRDYPGVPLYIISLKPSFNKQDQLPDQLVVNKLLREFADRTPAVGYIDITKDMYYADGKLREDIFVEDRLHMNRKGYDIWTAIIKPILIEGLGL